MKCSCSVTQIITYFCKGDDTAERHAYQSVQLARV
uniref:Uncharacterized protein n=1 Tax=Anguilla anguilla TaxID=7936 RepID=A0A0E9XBF9_ANGAN